MADNTTLNTMAGGDVISTDDVGGGVKVQRVKVQFGVDGAAADVTATNGLPVQGVNVAAQTTAWTSATAGNTANSISVVGMNTVTVSMSNTSTMTNGVLTFEVSPDSGTTWFLIAMARIDSFTVETAYTLSTVANRAWTTSVDGFTNFRVRLSTTITGSGTATVVVIPQAFAIEPIVTVGQSAAASLNATVTATNLSTNVAQVNGTTASTNSGAVGAGVMRVEIANNGTGVVGLNAGANTVGFVNPAPSTSATAALTVKAQAALTVVNAKASAGNVYGINVYNPNASVIYLQFYNTAGTPTLGTSVVWWIACAPSTTTNIPAGAMALNRHATGIGIGAATTATGAGAPAVAPDAVVFYA